MFDKWDVLRRGMGEKKDINLALFNRPEAWTVLSGEKGQTKADRLYSQIPIFFRGVDIIANSVASMPYDIVLQNGTVWNPQMEDDPPAMISGWINNLYSYLWLSATAITLTGAAYFEKEQNNIMPTSLLWRLPDTITPKFDKMGNLEYFERRLPTGRKERHEIEDIVYFWGLDHTVETGEPSITPATAILKTAAVLAGMQNFQAEYFAKGLIKAYFATYKDHLTVDEAKRSREYLRRLLSGIRRAFQFEVMRGDFELKEVGEGLENLKDGNISESHKWDILQGLGVPISLVFPSAANHATREQDQISFIETVILPMFNKVLLPALNNQLFNPLGIKIITQHKRLEVFEKAEAAKALNLTRLVREGLLTNREAREQMGLADIQPEIGGVFSLIELERAEKLAKLIGTILTTEEAREQMGLSGSVPEPTPEPTPPPISEDQIQDEIRAFKNFIRKGTHKKRNFESDILTPAQMQDIINEIHPPKDELKEKLNDALKRFDSAMAEHVRQPTPQPVNVYNYLPEQQTTITPPNIEIHPPEIKQGEIIVNMPAQDNPQIVVNVPEQEKPQVIIENNVEFPSGAREVLTVKRDNNGLISGTESQVIFEDNDNG